MFITALLEWRRVGCVSPPRAKSKKTSECLRAGHANDSKAPAKPNRNTDLTDKATNEILPAFVNV